MWCICHYILATLGKEGIKVLAKDYFEDWVIIRNTYCIFISIICFVLLYNYRKTSFKKCKPNIFIHFKFYQTCLGRLFLVMHTDL